MATNEKIGLKPFRYYDFWAEHPNFKEVVLENWYRPMKREGMTALYLKLMRLKYTIKRFNRERIGDVGKKYQEAKEHYLETRMQAQEHTHDLSYQQAEKEAAMNFNAEEKMYHNFLRQMSKVTWLCKGDENNAYFHAFLKKRRMESSIVTYTNEQGEIIDDFNEVVKHFIQHFQGYMGTSSITTQSLRTDCMELGNKLNLEQQLILIKPFTNKEIKKTFFRIPDSKSPGPDGYGAGFFKTMWPELGAEFTKAVENFFKTGSMPQDFHATMITLVPKTETPTKAVNFRPIAYCSTV
uniref:Reverse transcriptase n=1 Tax=Cannabis sativa TaxID=3483 RepID=A0A803Q707_CANSA